MSVGLDRSPFLGSILTLAPSVVGSLLIPKILLNAEVNLK